MIRSKNTKAIKQLHQLLTNNYIVKLSWLIPRNSQMSTGRVRSGQYFL